MSDRWFFERRLEERRIARRLERRWRTATMNEGAAPKTDLEAERGQPMTPLALALKITEIADRIAADARTATNAITRGDPEFTRIVLDAVARKLGERADG